MPANKNLISKKELLKLKGISYGQLYRWKRKNLIPEKWFIKKAVSTGQETFFERDRILDRIDMILKLKDNNSLEAIAAKMAPGVEIREFTFNDLKKVRELSFNILYMFEKQLKKESFTFIEVLFVYILGTIGSELKIDRNDLEDIVTSVKNWVRDIKDLSWSLNLYSRYSQVFALLVHNEAQLHTDSRTRLLKAVNLQDAANELKLKTGI